VTRRYAIYFAPPAGSELEAFGRRWLGRDHVTGEAVEQPTIDGVEPAELERITRSARHYGFHATLKAPFSLKEGETANGLNDAMERFAAQRTSFDAPPLRVACLSRWVALTLSAPCPELDRMAADCVRAFEPFRRALSADDIERRRQAGLTPRQDAQMLRYGYPYVFDDFLFHMTLAGPLDQARRDWVRDLLVKRAPTSRAPLRVDAVALYEQPNRESPFVQTSRFPFGR
jgi:putative phosphonate metabolism protein